MKQNKSTFESENLIVDWIGFNIQGLLDRKQVKQIAKYLFQNFGFNSTLALGSDGKEEILFNDSKNKYQVFFRIYKYSDIYWDGIKINFESFLKQCYDKVARNKAIKSISLQQNSLSWIFKSGKRGSPNYYRVYQNQTQIRFELEQRGATIKPAQKLIFQDHIEEFERVMTEKFFKYSKRVLAIDENYTDWLVDYYRRHNQF